MDRDYYRNIPLLYIYSIFIKRVSQPIIILYFLLNRLSFAQIGILAATTLVVQMTTDIYGGIFADTYGRKATLLLHSVFGAITMLFYFIGNSFPWFFLASIMYGIAGAFITGTRNSILYDTLIKLNRVVEFKKFNGRVLLYSHIINALVLLMIPVMYTFNVKLPFLFGIGFFLISFILALFFIEPQLEKKSERALPVYGTKIIEALREIKLNKKLIIAILLSMFTASFIFMGVGYIQPLLKISKLQVVYFGVVYALMSGLMGIGGLITHKLEKYFTQERLLILGLGGITISFLGFSFSVGVGIILAVLILKLSEGFNRIILEDEINKNIESKNRTTILSVTSLSKTLATSGLILIFGFISDLVGVQHMFNYALGLFFVIIIVTWILVNNIKRAKRREYGVN